MIRTMIVDDESFARQELIRLLKMSEDFEIVGEATTGREALEKLKEERADVIFLDIEMPGMNGLEVASALAEWPSPPLVVFATAYHEFAIEAFEANAIDYILKPFEPNRLRKTLERIKNRLKSKASFVENLISLENNLIEKGLLKKLAGHKRNSKDRVVFDPREVYYFDVQHSELIAHLEKEELIVTSTLKDLLSSLTSQGFVQTHKAYMVNLDKIEKVSPLFSGNYEIHLKDPAKTHIPLSRRYAQGLKQQLGNW